MAPGVLQDPVVVSDPTLRGRSPLEPEGFERFKHTHDVVLGSGWSADDVTGTHRVGPRSDEHECMPGEHEPILVAVVEVTIESSVSAPPGRPRHSSPPTTKTPFTRVDDVPTRQADAVGLPSGAEEDLRGNDRLVSAGTEGLAKDLLATPVSVGLGGIEEVDACVQRHREVTGRTLGIDLPELRVGSSPCRSEAERRHHQPGAAQRSVLHGRLPPINAP